MDDIELHQTDQNKKLVQQTKEVFQTLKAERTGVKLDLFLTHGEMSLVFLRERIRILLPRRGQDCRKHRVLGHQQQHRLKKVGKERKGQNCELGATS